MRIFIDAIEMLREVERDLFEMGTRYQTSTVQDRKVETDPAFQTIELFGYTYSLHDATFESLRKMLAHAHCNVDWADAEVAERTIRPPSEMSLNPGAAWRMHPDLWRPFLREGRFAYTYAERQHEQIDYVVNELMLRPNTRQAVLTMYDRHQDMMNWGGRDRVPCSLTYQFLHRDDRLHVIYNQRSCDFVNFFPYDVFFTYGLLNAIAYRASLKPGTITHFIGSLHAFAGDLQDKGIF